MASVAVVDGEVLVLDRVSRIEVAVFAAGDVVDVVVNVVVVVIAGWSNVSAVIVVVVVDADLVDAGLVLLLSI